MHEQDQVRAGLSLADVDADDRRRTVLPVVGERHRGDAGGQPGDQRAGDHEAAKGAASEATIRIFIIGGNK